MIDAHQHLWKFNATDFPWISTETPCLRHDFGVAELADAIDMCAIDHAVSVQARCSDTENQFLLDQAKNSEGLITGIVGWAPLTSHRRRIFLDQYIHEPLIKGFREIIKGTPDDQFLDNPDFDLGLRELTHRDYTFDLLISHDQLPAAIELADRHPNQQIVLNHCGNPPIQAGEFPTTWARNIRELARRPHVYCKLSGLTTEIQDQNITWQTDLIRPYFDTILNAFSPQRIMFGSDWPTSLQNTTYPAWLNAVDDLLLPLSHDEKSAITDDTARDFYQL